MDQDQDPPVFTATAAQIRLALLLASHRHRQGEALLQVLQEQGRDVSNVQNATASLVVQSYQAITRREPVADDAVFWAGGLVADRAPRP